MAENKEAKAKAKLKADQAKAKTQGFHHKNTVEIEINGKKKRVNKFEAEALKKKLADGPKNRPAVSKGADNSAALKKMQEQLDKVAKLAEAQAAEITALKEAAAKK